MPLAIFDLDNTPAAGDSDYLWGQFLGEIGVVDPVSYQRENDRFFEDHREGRLDIMAFLAFSLRPLAQNTRADLDAWHQRFMREKIEPLITAGATELVERHRAAGDTLMIITATNAFVTAPIARRLGIPHLIATEPEQQGATSPAELPAPPVSARARSAACSRGCRNTMLRSTAPGSTATRTTTCHCSNASLTRSPSIRTRCLPIMPPRTAGLSSACWTRTSRYSIATPERVTVLSLRRHIPLLTLSLTLAMASVALALRLGSADIPSAEVWAHVIADDGSINDRIIDQLRLPRALTAFAVGGLLALAGALIQVLLRNPPRRSLCAGGVRRRVDRGAGAPCCWARQSSGMPLPLAPARCSARYWFSAWRAVAKTGAASVCC